MQTLNLWLVVPSCYSCALSQSCDGVVRPYVQPGNWESDIRYHAGKAVLQRTKWELRNDPDFAYSCWACGEEVRPWTGDQMSVSHVHLEEHFKIEVETPGRWQPPQAVKKLVRRLYGNKCFGCNAPQTRTRQLHIDHIIPQSKGGTSAFRNLQPLCTECGNIKKDQMPDEIELNSTILFGRELTTSDEFYV